MGLRYGQGKYGLFKYGKADNAFQFKVQISNSDGVVQSFLNNQIVSLSWEYKKQGGCGKFKMELKRNFDDLSGLTATNLQEMYDIQVFVTSGLGGTSTLYYRGYVDGIRPSLEDSERVIVSGCGYSNRLDKIIIHDGTGAPREYTNTTISGVLSSLVNDFITPKTSIAEGDIDTFLTQIISMKFNGTVKEALDKLASIVGAEWGVDRNKELYFLNESQTVSDRFVIGKDISVINDEYDYSEIVNSLIIEGGDVENEAGDSVPFRSIEEDQASIDLYGLHQKVVKNSSITDAYLAKQYAQSVFYKQAMYSRNLSVRLPFNKKLIETSVPLGRVTMSKNPLFRRKKYGTFKYCAADGNILTDYEFELWNFLQLDAMEYATDGAAQSAYVTNDAGVYTSDVCSGGVVTASNESYGDADGAFANDGTSTYWYANTVPQWIQYDFGSGVTKTIKKYRVMNKNQTDHAPAAWVFAGSNDGTNFTTLDSRSGQTWSGGGVWKEFEISNSVAYRYYRITVSSVVAADKTQWAEIEMMEQSSPSLQVYSEATVKSQGSYAIKGVASTSALNKTLTKTIASPIDLSGINSVQFDIRSTRTGSNIKIGIHDSGGTTTEITPNIGSANQYQKVVWDLSAVSDANKNAIDSIIITIVDASESNTFYLDDLRYVMSTNWTLAGTGAAADRESTIIKSGTYSAKLIRTGNDASLYQSIGSILSTGKKGTFGCWVYATVASRARIGIVTDGGGTEYSAYHSGTPGWEYLTVTATISGTPSYVRATCQVNTGDTTAYFDSSNLIVLTIDSTKYSGDQSHRIDLISYELSDGSVPVEIEMNNGKPSLGKTFEELTFNLEQQRQSQGV